MAPSAPTKRKPLRLKATERLANPLAPRKVHRPTSAVTDAFLDTKADRQRIRRAAFVSRIAKPSSAAAAAAAARKNARRHARRREQKQQQQQQQTMTLDALADALPALTADEVAAGDAERGGRVRHKSLRSRPGALRRKERVVKGEMERFGVSLAQLAGVQETTTTAVAAAATAAAAARSDGAADDDAAMEGVQGEEDQKQQQQQQQQKSASANRFAALRGFISATLEQNPAFAQRDAAVAAPGVAKGA